MYVVNNLCVLRKLYPVLRVLFSFSRLASCRLRSAFFSLFPCSIMYYIGDAVVGGQRGKVACWGFPALFPFAMSFTCFKIQLLHIVFITLFSSTLLSISGRL